MAALAELLPAAAPGVLYNYSAGPGMLPRALLAETARRTHPEDGSLPLTEWSHRDTRFAALAEHLEEGLRELLEAPRGYRFLFLQGGASAQFAMLPMNLLRGRQSACYLHGGYWSGQALEEARRYAAVRVAARAAGEPWRLPPRADWEPDEAASYFYYTDNETVEGLEFPGPPDVGALPLAADLTSNFLTRPLALERFALVFAGAQKNLGSAGLTVVIVREELLGRTQPGTPSLYDYSLLARRSPAFNTPVLPAWYLAERMVDWTRREGGLKEMEARCRRRARELYKVLDGSGFYQCATAPEWRSRVNACFRIADRSLEAELLREAAAAGLAGLAGHRSRGGLRASLYNGMPMAGARVLAEFLREFERHHG